MGIDTLLATDHTCIITGDLNAKYQSWNSHTQNSASTTLYSHMNQNVYIIAASSTLTHYPDQQNHRPDVLDITISKKIPVPFQIQNLNKLSFDHNPVLLELQGKPIMNPWLKINKTTNCKKCSTDLHQAIHLPNPIIHSIEELE